MLKTLSVERFKSLVKLDLELGRINVFIGANGSGKSNLLEALGVLGAAAFGRVDDETLQRRGVRPGVPKLYKTAFPGVKGSPHILFGAEESNGASYHVTLWNPLYSPEPAWKFKTERLSDGESDVYIRSTTSVDKRNQEQGIAALKTVELTLNNPSLALINTLRSYSIYCPNTPCLRGSVPDSQSREPVGLAGGRLPEAVGELLEAGKQQQIPVEILEEVRDLIDWAKEFSAEPSTRVPLSPAAARSRYVIQFVDRFMAHDRNRLTGYDASEGALYILYCAALALHPKAPRCLAIDNVDQALNPKLASKMMRSICAWTKKVNGDRQWLVTAHNPAILDGLPIDDPDVRLFAVDRNDKGHTVVRRIKIEEAADKRPNKAWTLSRMWMNGLLGGVPNV
ncbi:MAG: AAA family ATPase [Planctomycetota bacterium]